MHGVRKGKSVSSAEKEQEHHRSAFNADLIRRSLALRNETIPSPLTDAFRSRYRVVEAAVEANPDEYSLWSFRREVLLVEQQAIDSTPRFDELWEKELELTIRALRRHPKAYPAWQHRLWLLDDKSLTKMLSTGLQEKARGDEHKLSAFMLSKDGRNFHVWAHRMRVRAALLNHDPSSARKLDLKETTFVEDMINKDFANYSAWHHRSVLLPRLDKISPNVIEKELEFVQQAFFTEPDVQSVWFYHRWLMAGAPKAGSTSAPVKTDGETLLNQLEVCNTLLDIEPGARLALQEKAYILQQLGRDKEREEVLGTLERIDPMRKGYYRYLRSTPVRLNPA